jgi:hypothetical protein
MNIERTGWAAAVGTQYKMRDGRTVKLTQYQIFYAEPGSSAADNYRVGLNEIIEGNLIHGKDEPCQRFEWDGNGICGEHMTEVLVDEPQPGYKAGEWRTGHSNPAYDLIEQIRGGRR